MHQVKTLLLGFGNVTRQDDGAAWEVLHRLQSQELPGVEIRFSQQLGVEILEEWGDFDQVLFVDAAPGGQEVQVEQVQESTATPSASTHHLKPETLLTLSKTLYGKCPSLFLCRIPGEIFGYGSNFSTLARNHIHEAVQRIGEWIHQIEEKHHA